MFGDEEDSDDDGEPIIDSIAEFGSSVLDLLYQLRGNGVSVSLSSCSPSCCSNLHVVGIRARAPQQAY